VDPSRVSIYLDDTDTYGQTVRAGVRTANGVSTPPAAMSYGSPLPRGDRNHWDGDHSDRLSGRNSAGLCFVSAPSKPSLQGPWLHLSRLYGPAYHSEVHHRSADWAEGGQTNVDDETLACGRDNRHVRPGGWRTRKLADGRTEWIPPPHLDTGQTRVNNYHHPERYLIPDEDNEEDADGNND
jgi:hypothetical protein